LDPLYQGARTFLGCIYLAQSKPDKALVEIGAEPDRMWRTFGSALVNHALGRNNEANTALETFVKDYKIDYAYQLAEIYGFRGELDNTFEWLERAYRQRDSGLKYLKGDPLLRSIEKDARYPAFMNKMKLPF
jgi:hypothetical protein